MAGTSPAMTERVSVSATLTINPPTNIPQGGRSIDLLARVLHVLDGGDDLAGDLAVLLHHLADVDVLDRIVGNRIHAERPARCGELHLGQGLGELVLVGG